MLTNLQQNAATKQKTVFTMKKKKMVAIEPQSRENQNLKLNEIFIQWFGLDAHISCRCLRLLHIINSATIVRILTIFCINRWFEERIKNEMKEEPFLLFNRFAFFISWFNVAPAAEIVFISIECWFMMGK